MKKILLTAFSAGMIGAAAYAGNQTIDYTSWTSASPIVNGNGTVGGTLTTQGGPVSVSYSGNVAFSQINDSGTQFWTQPNPSLQPYTGNSVIANAPISPDIVALDETTAGPNTITFSQAVDNPIMLINSLGQGGVNVKYNFNQSFILLGAGQGFFGGDATSLSQPDPTTLSGNEGAGAIEFLGPVSQISWTTSGGEFWNGFTLGATDVQSVPDQFSTFSGLLGVLGSLGLWQRIRRR